MSLTVRHLPDGSVEVLSDIAVGIEARRVTVPLGRFAGPVDPGGLRNAPVVVLHDARVVEIVRVGVRRSGGASVAVVDLPVGSVAGAELLRAASTAEVTLVVPPDGAAPSVLVAARALSGRPLPVVPLDDHAAAHAMLRGCDVDLDVAVPSVGGATRALIRRAADGLGLFSDHHVVEVDPRPGLAQNERAGPASLLELTAAATGVLAGRIAAENRRWR
ncbi:MAG TPA: hypothetical protein VNC60_10500 [Actinomycetota bacterium]|nr:hypothetical protein [Actinomycetota bacterium]